MKGSRRIHAGDTAFGRVAADAQIDDMPGVAFGVELALEIVGKALAGVEPEAGGEAIAKDDQDFARVWSRSC